MRNHLAMRFLAPILALTTVHTSFADPSAAMGVPAGDTSGIFGVTLDDVTDVDGIVQALSQLSRFPTSRIVFDLDENDPFTANPEDYELQVSAIHPVSDILGEPFDSYYWDCDVHGYCFSPDDYVHRFQEYLNNSTLLDNVDTWEVGNEANGDWLNEGDADGVRRGVEGAYAEVKARGAAAALTLFYYPPGNVPGSDYDMMNWASQLSSEVRQGLDYVLVSWYEDQFDYVQPAWQDVFDQLQQLFPNSQLGFGEIGPADNSAPEFYKLDLINRIYSLDQCDITTANYRGGFFWWYFAEDGIPATHDNDIFNMINTFMALYNSEPCNDIPICANNVGAAPQTAQEPCQFEGSAGWEPDLPYPISDDFEGYALEDWGECSLHGHWNVKFHSGGYTRIANLENYSQVLMMSPAANTETRSALTLTQRSFRNVNVAVQSHTVAQLHTNPNSWEVPWLFWHYSDIHHFYYFLLKPTISPSQPGGYEVGQVFRDQNGYQRQRFMLSGDGSYPINQVHDLKVQQVGDVVTVWGDGQRLAQCRDNYRPYMVGQVGLYTEDAEVWFDNFVQSYGYE